MRYYLMLSIFVFTSLLTAVKSQTIAKKKPASYELKIGGFANSLTSDYILLTDTFQNYASPIDYKLRWTARIELLFNLPLNEKHSFNYGVMLKKYRYPQRPCIATRCLDVDVTVSPTYFSLPFAHQLRLGSHRKTMVSISNGLQMDIVLVNPRSKVLRRVGLSYQGALKFSYQIGKTTKLVFTPQFEMAIYGYSKKTINGVFRPITYGLMVGVSKPLK